LPMDSVLQRTLQEAAFGTHLESLVVRSETKLQMINLTRQLDECIAKSGIVNGFAGVFSQHTTAVLLVNEWQSALLEDIGEFLHRVIEEGLPYKHNSPLFSDCDRGNATSHLRSLLFNNSVLLPIVEGRAVLGQFQSVILVELDGPRERTLKVQILGTNL
jgi:secondary thiamine-phosphate synthase enzyme